MQTDQDGQLKADPLPEVTYLGLCISVHPKHIAAGGPSRTELISAETHAQVSAVRPAQQRGVQALQRDADAALQGPVIAVRSVTKGISTMPKPMLVAFSTLRVKAVTGLCRGG
jgi:hypothetical protein